MRDFNDLAQRRKACPERGRRGHQGKNWSTFNGGAVECLIASSDDAGMNMVRGGKTAAARLLYLWCAWLPANQHRFV